MAKKYIKRNNSDIDSDYWHYLAMENIYTVVFGHRPKGYKKANYIWKRLLVQYYPDKVCPDGSTFK